MYLWNLVIFTAHESTSCWGACLEALCQHISFENIFFSSVSTTSFALLAQRLNLLRIRNVKDFLIKVSNIGTYKTYSYTKANTINFCNIYVVLCLRNIHFDYIVYHSNEKQNMNAWFNLVLCTCWSLFSPMWSDFWELTKAGPITSAFAFLNTSCGFTDNFLNFLLQIFFLLHYACDSRM